MHHSFFENPDLQSPQAQFALNIVLRLREAGFQALWAGGCVRDGLLGKIPKDFDVASDARPEQVIELFGRRRTVAVGASFGVVMVLGPNREAGQVEVATFRSDGQYLDGRRPQSVRFCSAEEDAQRRDFTINGMFYDPVDRCVLDYVDGRRDLADGIVRAIGDAGDRFTEDKLRMLRAVRFAATFGFDLADSTKGAVTSLSHQITQVSFERITQELKRMLSHQKRALAFRLLFETKLLGVLFPWFDAFSTDVAQLILSHLHDSSFESSLAAMFRTGLLNKYGRSQRIDAVKEECKRFKLSNAETDTILWLIESMELMDRVSSLPLHQLKPLLASNNCELLLSLSEATSLASGQTPSSSRFCRQYLGAVDRSLLDPPVLITGADLHAMSVPSGPRFREILGCVRNLQLDEQITSREDALREARRLAAELSR
ncbi:MAG: CCA tRNA nucleotidyltransferase [Planctomycetaceae bacterium]